MAKKLVHLGLIVDCLHIDKIRSYGDKSKKEMRTISAKVAFIHWTHQILVRIFGMFAFYDYLCHVIDDFTCFELQH